MTKLTAAALAAIVLAACSDSEETATSSETEQDGTTVQQPTTPSSETPCPETETERSGPKVTPSPVAVCEGAYECDLWSGAGVTSPNTKTFWFGFDGTNCNFGRDYVLAADGRIGRKSTEGLDDWGTWKGDYATFTMGRGDGPRDTCTRIPNQ